MEQGSQGIRCHGRLISYQILVWHSETIILIEAFMSHTASGRPTGPLTELTGEDLATWALQTAHSVGLAQAVQQYPEQVIRAAEAARNTLKALEDDMSGTSSCDRPTWDLSI